MNRTAGPGVLLTGATGYVGGRLLPRLIERGCRVRCLTRRPEELRARVEESVQVAGGDMLEPDSLGPALDGVDIAYYLVHSMGEGDGFRERERRAARNFARAAEAAGVRRIVYLGGLGDEERELSEHLESRQAVGRALRDSAVSTTEFRASIIIGSGSLSFEMIRALVDKLPVMILPRWVRTPAQPIAIEDVIDYLVAELDRPGLDSQVVEIGGADVVSYGDIMREYARQRDLRRAWIPVPVLTPWLSSLWLGLVTPVFARIGRQLIAGVEHPTIVRDPAPAAAYDLTPRSLREAIERALVNEDREFALTRWSDARSTGERSDSYGGKRIGSRFVDSRSTDVSAPPEAVFEVIERIGGTNGWYFADWLWSLRGLLDLGVGGVGVRRGRRDPAALLPGDTVDFWRVEDVEPPRLLRLRAEMRVPGRAWLQFEVEPAADGSPGARLTQTGLFDAAGLFGRVYWYALWPIHQLVFGGMVRGIARRAERGRAA
ncbi:MAG TPA: SDR family oxidoreductase [Gemmatimonadota bacterium]|nr:SDR family oxidoreductase [Gemmatimonadota bacterium]